MLETSALDDLARVCQVVADCREIGVSFTLDDCGAGDLSLEELKHLAVTRLKIDRSVIGDMLENPDDLAIVERILSLSKAFHRQVIATGMETLEQGELLLNARLRAGAGLWHRPPDAGPCGHRLAGRLAAITALDRSALGQQTHLAVRPEPIEPACKSLQRLLFRPDQVSGEEASGFDPQRPLMRYVLLFGGVVATLRGTGFPACESIISGGSR